MKKTPTRFTSQGATVKGYFHQPDRADEGPQAVVVMGNGFATEWQFGTQAIIKGLVAAGFTTLNFDYRGFGESDNIKGQPRQVLDTKSQLEDWRAAITHAKAQPFMDHNRLVLWGSSLGGGHCLTMAAEWGKDIACAVAQVPHCCSREAFKATSAGHVLKGMSKALWDQLGSLLGRSPVRVKIVEEPSNYGVMNYSGWKAHYKKIAANSATWENAIPARSLLKVGDYRPILDAPKIACPTLIVAGKLDAGVPFSAVEQTVALLPRGELHAYEGDHFEVYHGPLLDQIVTREVGFIQQNS